MNKKGNLYIIPTPIGNLGDITYRAVKTLKDVDLILCEDTRTTSKLLNFYNIKTKLKSYHKFNEEKSIEFIICNLEEGKNIALVSDAGTPIISDPGSKLIAAVYQKNIKVIPLPGASALTTALSSFGVDFADFLFLGFLPEKKIRRRELLESLKDRTSFALLYVAPHDLKKYLQEIMEVYPDIKVFMARELTKIYEEIWKGNICDLIAKLENVKGEIVLGLNFSGLEDEVIFEEAIALNEMKKSMDSGQSLKDASKNLAKKYRVQSSKLYNLYVAENK